MIHWLMQQEVLENGKKGVTSEVKQIPTDITTVISDL
jgi:hypothetical protein